MSYVKNALKHNKEITVSVKVLKLYIWSLKSFKFWCQTVILKTSAIKGSFEHAKKVV